MQYPELARLAMVRLQHCFSFQLSLFERPLFPIKKEEVVLQDIKELMFFILFFSE